MSLSTSDEESLDNGRHETNADTTERSNKLENIDTSSALTGNANNYQDEEHAVESMSPTIVDCHAMDDAELDVYCQVQVPKNGTPRDLSLTPITIAVVDTIGLVKSRRLLKVLLDPGLSGTMIKESVIPKEVRPVSPSRDKTIKTIAGKMEARQMVHLRGVRLPEFDKNRKINKQKALVFSNECRYDIVFGVDFLTKIGMDISYRKGVMEWYGNSIKTREPWGLNNQEYLRMVDSFFLQEEDDMLGKDWLDSYAFEKILDAKYEKLDIEELMSKQNHLDARQKQGLGDLFQKYEKLFDDTLRLYPHKKVHIETVPGAKAKHMRPYAVPKVHMDTFNSFPAMGSYRSPSPF